MYRALRDTYNASPVCLLMNDWFLATLNISCVSVHSNMSSFKYWLKKNKREGFKSKTFAWQVWFLTQEIWSQFGRSFIILRTLYLDHLYNYVYIVTMSTSMCFNVHSSCLPWGCVAFKISCYRIELKLFTWSQTMLWATRVSSFKFSTSTSLLTLKLSSTVACPCDKIRISFYNIEKTLVDLVCHAFKEYPLCLLLIGS